MPVLVSNADAMSGLAMLLHSTRCDLLQAEALYQVLNLNPKPSTLNPQRAVTCSSPMILLCCVGSVHLGTNYAQNTHKLLSIMHKIHTDYQLSLGTCNMDTKHAHNMHKLRTLYLSIY